MSSRANARSERSDYNSIPVDKLKRKKKTNHLRKKSIIYGMNGFITRTGIVEWKKICKRQILKQGEDREVNQECDMICFELDSSITWIKYMSCQHSANTSIKSNE